MTGSVSWMERGQEVHPIPGAGPAQFQLVHIHPFAHGNGRKHRRFLSMLHAQRNGDGLKLLFRLSEHDGPARSSYHRAIQSVLQKDLALSGQLSSRQTATSPRDSASPYSLLSDSPPFRFRTSTLSARARTAARSNAIYVPG